MSGLVAFVGVWGWVIVAFCVLGVGLLQVGVFVWWFGCFCLRLVIDSVGFCMVLGWVWWQLCCLELGGMSVCWRCDLAALRVGLGDLGLV